MAWTLKWGAHVKAFQANTKKSGIVAGPMKNRPRLRVEDAPYYEAFNRLNSARQPGMSGEAPITISEVLALLQLVGIASRRERVKYLDLIQELDQVALEHWAQEASRQK